MNRPIKDHKVYDTNKGRLLLIICGGVLIVFIIIYTLIAATRPDRSISNFCNVADDQKTFLVKEVNYEQRLEAYKKLENVSPDDIRPDISTIRKGYEEVVASPSQTLNAGIGMSTAVGRANSYIKSNCKGF